MQSDEQEIIFSHSYCGSDKHESFMRLDEGFISAARFNADKVVIQMADKSYTYGEVDLWSSNVAAELIKHRGEEDLKTLAIFMEKGIDLVVAIVAALKADFTYFTVDTKYPESRIQYMLEDSCCDAVLVNNDKNSDIFVGVANVVRMDKLNYKNCDSALLPKNYIKRNSIACLIYTSGSTGDPKPVMVTHAGIVNLLCNQLKYFGVGCNDRILQFSSVSFDSSIPEVWLPLISGAMMVIPEDHYLSGKLLEDIILHQKISTIIIPPSILDTMANPAKLSACLQTVVSVGEALTQSTIERWRPHIKNFLNAYGPSEATVCTTFLRYSEQISDENVIGKPLDGVNIYLLNADLTLTPIGCIGELYIGGIGLSPGYYRHPELSEGRFIPSPFDKTQKIYKSGDLAKWRNDGNLQYVGRVDQQVKINGVRIELGEIENQICNHPSVNFSVVLAQTIGETVEKKLVAYYTIKESEKSGWNNQSMGQSIREFLRGRLLQSMIPHKYVLIDELPRLPNGKVDRDKLKEFTSINYDGPMESDGQRSPAEHKEIDSDLSRLLQLYAKVLNIRNIDDIDLSLDFFELGGTSLSALQLLSDVKECFSIELSIDQFFENSSLNYIKELLTPKTYCELEGSPSEKKYQMEDDLFFDLQSLMGENFQFHTPPSVINHILLTGATGFLGIYLLRDLLSQYPNAVIHCLVRESKDLNLNLKLKAASSKYCLESDIDFNRVEVYEGDISKENLGLSSQNYNELVKKIDSVFHCAAAVNHLHSYAKLREVNVLGTIELMKFSTRTKGKFLHYVSALDITLIKNQYPNFSAQQAAIHEKMGYIQTKWVSEYLLNKMSSLYRLNVRIYRPGNIIGDLKSGIMDPNKNHFLMLAKGCLQMQHGPRANFSVEMSPVDLVSKAIALLSKQKDESHFAVYYLHNPNFITWIDYVGILHKLGYGFDLIEPAMWIGDYVSKIDSQNALYPFKEYYQRNAVGLNVGLNDLADAKTADLMEKLSISYPCDYMKLNEQYIAQLKKVGFI